jgi:hypothetical protein
LYLAFQSIAIRSICENVDDAIEVLGMEIAKKLHTRVAELRAAKFASDLFVGRPRQITHTDRPAMAVNFASDYQLVFVSNHEKRRIAEAAPVDWSKVSDIQIVDIGREYE